MDSEITIDEYLQIREDVACFLEEKMKRKTCAFDKLPSDKHREIVLNNAIDVYNKSKEIEPFISKDLCNLALSLGGELKSFEHRLKGIESLKRKIIADSKEYEGDYSRAAHNICDGVRYTVVIDDLEYVEIANNYLQELEKKGYLVVDFKNNWGKDFYQGFNVRLSPPSTEEIFEIQFHTPYGYQIKEGSTRDLYEVVRDDGFSKELLELKQKCNKLRKVFQKSVKIPPNALKYNFEHNVKSK